MKLRGAILLAAAIAAGAGGWAYWSLRPTAVTVADVIHGTAAEIVYATGVIEPERWAKVTPVIRGRIVESCDCEGEWIEQGDLLFRLDDTELRAHDDELTALLTLAEQELHRTTGLYERGVATRVQFDRDLAEVARLRASLAATRSQIADMTIRSPLDGQVLRIEGEVGEVAPLGEVLAWVGRPAPLLVIAEVNEEDIPRVDSGQRAMLKADAFPDRPLEARVSSITPMGNPELKTYRVRLALPADTPLFIGMSVDVNIIVRTVADAVLVPAPALIGGAVQAVGQDNRIELRPVETGIQGAERVQITAGIDVGERVVSPALDGLKQGARVRPATAPGSRANAGERPAP